MKNLKTILIGKYYIESSIAVIGFMIITLFTSCTPLPAKQTNNYCYAMKAIVPFTPSQNESNENLRKMIAIELIYKKECGTDE